MVFVSMKLWGRKLGGSKAVRLVSSSIVKLHLLFVEDNLNF